MPLHLHTYPFIHPSLYPPLPSSLKPLLTRLSSPTAGFLNHGATSTVGQITDAGGCRIRAPEGVRQHPWPEPVWGLQHAPHPSCDQCLQALTSAAWGATWPWVRNTALELTQEPLQQWTLEDLWTNSPEVPSRNQTQHSWWWPWSKTSDVD